MLVHQSTSQGLQEGDPASQEDPPPPRPTHRGRPSHRFARGRPSHRQRAPARLPLCKPSCVVCGPGCMLVRHPNPQGLSEGGPAAASEQIKQLAKDTKERLQSQSQTRPLAQVLPGEGGAANEVQAETQTRPVRLGVLCMAMATCWFIIQLPRVCKRESQPVRRTPPPPPPPPPQTHPQRETQPQVCKRETQPQTASSSSSKQTWRFPLSPPP